MKKEMAWVAAALGLSMVGIILWGLLYYDPLTPKPAADVVARPTGTDMVPSSMYEPTAPSTPCLESDQNLEGEIVGIGNSLRKWAFDKETSVEARRIRVRYENGNTSSCAVLLSRQDRVQIGTKGTSSIRSHCGKPTLFDCIFYPNQ